MDFFRFISLVIFFSLCLFFKAQGQEYSRVRIDLSERSLFSLSWLNLEIDHGKHIAGRYFESDFSRRDIAKMEKAGISFEILVQDSEEFYRNSLERAQIEGESFENDRDRYHDCFESQFDFNEPENFKLGSMSGYYRYAEIQDELDLMAAKFPHLISERSPIDTFKTFEGRPIFWTRISNSPNEDQFGKRQILYTSLHHAREPMSVTALIYYMWYLLENYESNEEIRALVDNSELYFVPVVNPDGVLYNESQSPNGGGLWRKNRRDNGDGTFGVDLNRNYAENWAFDDAGSSGNPVSAVYRGAEPFSEPETRAIKHLCENHNFVFAMNYHSFGNLLVFPYGYEDRMPVDSVQFRGFAKVMTRDNNYIYGNSSETVNYATNGDSDDWMYDANELKEKIYAFTPEVGQDGFYPTNIRELAEKTLYQNLSTLRLIHNYAEFEILSDRNFYEDNYFLKYKVDQFGLSQGEPVIVRVTPYNNNLLDIDPAKAYQMLPGESVIDSIRLSLIGEPVWGQDVEIIVEMDYGLYSIFDTIKLVYGVSDILTMTTGDDLYDNWESNELPLRPWGTTDEYFYSGPASITDSPYDNYSSNAVYEITTIEPVDLTQSVRANMSFYAKWDLEDNYDYVQILIAEEGAQFEPICGRYTTQGTVFQDSDTPVYDGNQNDWIRENIDLEEYLGKKVQVRFKLVSDGLNNKDGFYFDNFKIRSINIEDTTSTSIQTVQSVPMDMKIYPNPARVSVTLDLSEVVNYQEIEFVSLYNSIGQKVFSMPWNGDYKIVVNKNSAGLSSGLFLVNLEGRGKSWSVGKILFLE